MKKSKNCFLTGWKSVLLDKCLIFFCLARKNQKPFPTHPKKILLANWGSLGDIVLSSGVVAEIKNQFPDCQIGFIASKASKVVLETYPHHLDWIHEVDSWYNSGRTSLQKIVDILKFLFIKQPLIAKQLKKIGYDCAIELRPFFPNIIPVFWKAKIPLKLGFTSSGNGRFLSHPVDWGQDQYLPHCYRALLEKIGIVPSTSFGLMPKMSLKNVLPNQIPKPYILFHLCSSYQGKEFPSEFWIDLYQKCKERGYVIYFTGKGKRERELICRVIHEERYNLCDKLDWKMFVQLVQESQGIVSVDSVPVHLAASFNIPCAVLFRDTPFPEIWNPNIPTCTAFGLKASIRVMDIVDLIENWSHP